MKWEVAVARADELGESPFWHPGDSACLGGHPGCRVGSPATGAGEDWELPQEPGASPQPTGRGGLVWRCATGSIARAAGAARCSHRALPPRDEPRFNDGKADPLGYFWAGTYYDPGDARKADLYSLDCRPTTAAT